MASAATTPSSDGDGGISLNTLKQRVLRVPPTIKTLDSWQQQLPETLTIPNPFSSYVKAEILSIENEPNLPRWFQRQKTVLELAYHNACTLSLRDFLCHPLTSRENAPGDGDEESAMILSCDSGMHY
ncbi:hypothetical protein TGAM01_v206033 [Trichoderma gamsii]|uniref:Uncharacterized protein n=1 Tax=Trichoderma gamsii TaxID=398673 RepID=A0A2P4ZKY2_9HYPO|nr:hypothetical protein TGAM01_v206033 [Trichoderma gamsii]PON24952.1 hypothetical protein TGAM01_v206033 [Trichoderma gamsii]